MIRGAHISSRPNDLLSQGYVMGSSCEETRELLWKMTFLWQIVKLSEFVAYGLLEAPHIVIPICG